MNAVMYESLSQSLASNAQHLQYQHGTAITPHPIAIVFMVAKSGGILVTWLLGSLSPPFLYRKATVALLVIMMFFAGENIYCLWSQNRKKAAIHATMMRNGANPGLDDKSAWFIYNS